MESESNTEAIKIDIHENAKGETISTIQDGERENLLEGDSEAKSRTGQVKGGNSCLNGENNTDTTKLDIKVSGQGKTILTLENHGERKCLVESKSKGAEPKWVDQVKWKYESTEYIGRTSSPSVSIYRVPESIKRTKPEAYNPLVISLGPFHHNKHQQLTAADDYKLQAIGSTLGRLCGMTIKDFVENIRELENEIRNCYEDSAIEWDGDALAWIMSMDACFIIEFLRMDMPDSSLVFHSRKQYNIKRQEIMSDIMKLENQIPFCVLKRILELELKPENHERDQVPYYLAQYLSCMSWYFESFPFSLGGYDDLVPKISNLIDKGAQHLLDLSRKMITEFLSNSCSSSEPARKCCDSSVRCGDYTCSATPYKVSCVREVSDSPPTIQESFIPSAVKLKTAGIKLKASKGKLDFQRKRFRRSTLLLPEITVEDDTETLLRNLVAFEECHMNYFPPMKRVISGYMWIMDQLINSREDVQLLQDADIIKNYLGTEDEVAKIFNDLCTGITSADDFKDVSKNVSEHFRGWENLKDSMKDFQENTCPNAWYIVSFVLAMVIFVNSLLQTIYTIMSYYHS